MGNESTNESSNESANESANESRDGDGNGTIESMPGSVAEATATGQAAAVDGLVQDSGLAAVRLPSWTMGRVSVGGVAVVAVALGGLVAALSMRRGRSHMPVRMEEEWLSEGSVELIKPGVQSSQSARAFCQTQGRDIYQ